MMLSAKKIQEKLEKLQVLDLQQKEVKKQVDMLKDELKAIMDDNGLEKLIGTSLYCYYKDVLKQVVDTDLLKEHGIYTQYLKDTEYKMFKYDVIK